MMNLRGMMKEKLLTPQPKMPKPVSTEMDDPAPTQKPNLLKRKGPFNPAASTEVRPPASLLKRLTGR